MCDTCRKKYHLSAPQLNKFEREKKPSKMYWSERAHAFTLGVNARREEFPPYGIVDCVCTCAHAIEIAHHSKHARLATSQT